VCALPIYSPGMRVIIRDEEWIVKKVDTNSDGGYTLFTVGVTPLVKDKDAEFLANLEDITIVNPARVEFIPDTSSHYLMSKLYLESQLRRRTPTDNKLHIGNQAAMDVLDFQLEPACMALANPRQRILIADTVGLGKTLEAGILMSELIARGKGKRILVVTVKSMMTQFQKELWNRFTIPLVRLDSNKIQRIRAEIPTNHNPFNYYDKTIISVDTLKRDVEYRTYLEDALWDIIVIDEAHNVAERGGSRAQRNRLAKLLANRSDSLILLSATPHDGHAESFASLMNMLDPTAIANPHLYTKDDIKGLCVRRFKKDVQGEIGSKIKERIISVKECNASALEEQVFSAFENLHLEMDSRGHNIAGHLFKTTLLKSFLSSPAACIKSVDERLKKLAKKRDSFAKRDSQQLVDLQKVLNKIKPESFSRYKGLLELLRDNSYEWHKEAVDDRLVIFTERIETMIWLTENLRRDLNLNEKQVVCMSGSMSDQEQQDIVEKFGRTQDPIRILVASDVASEGINLHYLSHRMIHFDIPWSLMVFQQRNGRIDRYGQSKQPDIRYMVVQSKNVNVNADLRILRILIDKEKEAHDNIGDPADLMKQYTIDGEESVVAKAIEEDTDPESFAQALDEKPELDLLSDFLGYSNGETEITIAHDKTLYSNYDYLLNSINFLNSNIVTAGQNKILQLAHHAGLELKPSTKMMKRFKKILPAEAIPSNGLLDFSDDKEKCMEDMKQSLQNSLDEKAWPKIQYLWAQHPIFDWLNDVVATTTYKRQEVPALKIPSKLRTGECIFIVSALIPNRKAIPVIDEWIGLRFLKGQFVKIMDFDQILAETSLNENIQNYGDIDERTLKKAQQLLPEVIKEVTQYMTDKIESYNKDIKPVLDERIAKLAELESKHLSYIKYKYEQQDLFKQNRKKEQEERITTELFDEFEKSVMDTLEIENVPHIQVMALITGGTL
jgi:superfamily II DNA or RNA helicase